MNKRFLILGAALAALCLTSVGRASTTEVYATNVDAAGTDLRWVKFLPLSAGPWPAALVIHEGGYKNGNPGPSNVAADLAAAGFLTFAIEYRLAPIANGMTNAGPPGDPQFTPLNGYANGSDGRPPQQTNDVAAAVAAARAYPGCNGQVAIVAGSSGAGHALFVTTIGASSSRPDVVVCLSGIYDLSDTASNSESSTMGRNPTFTNNLCNYLGFTAYTDSGFDAAAKAASPDWQSGFATTPVPILLVSADADTIPTPQYNLAKAALIANGRTAEFIFRTTGSTNADPNQHGFQAWSKTTGLGGTYPILKDYVIDFLFRKLGDTPPPVEAPANIVINRK